MDSETSTGHYVGLLERVLLDRNAEATHVPLSLLEHITNSFSNDRQIGSGRFAVVYKGIVGKGLVAVKKLSKTYNLPESKFHKEVECLMKAKHKNIVRFLGYCSETHGRIADNEGKFVMADIRNWLLCFEYVTNGSLDKYITDASRGLEWRERYVIIKGMCEGLLHLHEKHILHLDLKPGNILVDDHMVPKIADFGLSRCLDKDQSRAFTSNICGSLGYMAPEFLRGQVSFASDIYSLGVIIVEILTGEKEYPEDENVVETWMNRLEESDQWKTQLEQVRVCIKIGIECMDSNPKKRPDARHINDRLDKMASIVETGIGSSSIEQEVNFLKEQFHEEETSKFLSLYYKNYTEECAETEELADYVETPREDHWQQEASGDQWPAVMKQNFSPQGESISSSISGVLDKLKNLDIFGRKAQHRLYMMNNGPRLYRTNNVVKVKNFEYIELKTFLNYNNLIGKGGFGEVYRGLVDGEQVVIRNLIGTPRNFANEVTIQGQITHKNIVTLLGCCLAGMLVYEFLTRGSLHDILHNNKVPLNLDLRLSIAAESSKGLAYMHSEASIPIIHGDVRPANILLDDNFVPKISDVGRSRLIVRGYGHSERPTRDMAYMDPVFLQTGLLTIQSDVYSFGVVMLELLTRKKATHDENNSLVRNFIENHMIGRKATELFDKEIAVAGDLEVLDKLAEIAVQCLNLDVELRPTMMDVRDRLCALNLYQSP